MGRKILKASKAVAKALKYALAGAFALVLAFVAVALVVLQWPGILINERTLEWGRQYAGRHGIDIHWAAVGTRAYSESFLRKRIELDAGQLCVRASGASACFRRFAIGAAVDFSGLIPKLVRLDPVIATGGRVSYVAAPSHEKASMRPKPSGPATWPGEWLEKTALGQVDIEVDRWEARLPGIRASGDLRASNPGYSPGHGRKLTRLTLALDGMARLPAARAHGPRRANVALRLTQKSDTVVGYRIDAKYLEPARRVEADARVAGDLDPRGIRGQLDGYAEGFTPSLKRIYVSGCDYAVTETSAGRRPRAKVSVDCPVSFGIPLPPVPHTVELKVPSRTGARLRVDADTSFPPSAGESVSGNVELALDPILTPVLEGDGGLRASVAGIPSEFPRNWKLDTEMGLRVRVPEFEGLVQRLDGSAWAVPAPLNVLTGSLEAGVRGHADLAGGVFPLYLTTRTSSSSQRLNIDGRGEVRLDFKGKRGTQADLALVLSDVRLALPRLDLEKPPRFIPDKRIHRFSEYRKSELAPAASSGSAFKYRIRVSTPADQPVELLSNLAKAPVPIAVNLSLSSDQPMSGSVKVADFPLELEKIRRQATVERFDVQFVPGNEEAGLNGSIRVDYADYTIRILLLGTTDHPDIKFTSDPPLPEDQVIAVLIFGETIDQLDPDQTESVGSTRSAVADHAIGLASLYFLASTPIQSVGYDPATGTVTTKVRLGAGTSLNVGSGSEAQTIGIRKRLGKNVVIDTDVSRQTDTGNRVASAYVEWSHRY